MSFFKEKTSFLEKLFFISIVLTIFLALFEANAVENNHEIIRPFGFPNRQPPTSNSIEIVDFKVGLEAQQVCGYTDWSTASLLIPKHLLSKQYWSAVGRQLINQAKKMISDISGALPGMLACNVSPTWCSVLNKNQMLAAFESRLTFDSCNMLEGVANNKHLQATQLKNCIRKKLRSNEKLTAGQAREACLVNPTDPDGGTSKKDKIAQSAKDAGSTFSMREFFNDLFPNQVKKSNGSSISLTSGDRSYSLRSKTLEFAKKLFPGIEVQGTATVMQGGTFQPTIDEEVQSELSEIERAIIEALKVMVKFRNQGFAPRQIIAKSSYLWSNKNKWKREKKPHPFYRASTKGGVPSFLVTPVQVVSLLPLVDSTKSDLMTPELRQLVGQIARGTAHIKVIDRVSDLYTRALDLCKRSPKYQEALAQANCDLILQRTKSQMDIAFLKQESEEKAKKVQFEVAQMVNSIQRDRARRNLAPAIQKGPVNNSPLPLPWQ